MPEGFDHSEPPVARGRRSPELALELEAEQMRDAGEDPEVDIVGLYPGDSILAKVTLAGQTPIGDGWFTYGVQSRVDPNESELEAFSRVMDVVNTRVMDLADDAIERLEQRNARPQGRARINPRG